MSIIRNKTVDVNQILPLKYPWAWEHYMDGVRNNWLPNEVPMQTDIQHWKGNDLSPGERQMIMRNLGFFSTAESLVANNIVLCIYKYITNPEARQYLLRQAYEEAVHTHTFLYIVQNLGLSEQEVFNAYNEIPSIANKDKAQMQLTSDLLERDLDLDRPEDLKAFVLNLIGFYIVMEGMYFYSGFVMILSLMRQNKVPGIGEQFQYILRDESLHLAFGADLINTIVAENPEVWDNELQEEIERRVIEAVALETDYARDCLSEKVLGMNPELFLTYMKYIADRRMESINLNPIYGINESPFPWMEEIIDAPKEKNFFETRVTDYQTGGLEW